MSRELSPALPRGAFSSPRPSVSLRFVPFLSDRPYGVSASCLVSDAGTAHFVGFKAIPAGSSAMVDAACRCWQG